jgi:hypothetical protein
MINIQTARRKRAFGLKTKEQGYCFGDSIIESQGLR